MSIDYSIIDTYLKNEDEKEAELHNDFINININTDEINEIAIWILDNITNNGNYQAIYYLEKICKGDLYLEVYKHAIPIDNEYTNLYFLLKQNLPYDSQFYSDFLTSDLFWKYNIHDFNELISNQKDYFNTISIYEYCNQDDNNEKDICSCFSEQQYKETFGDFISNYCSSNDEYCKTVLGNMQLYKYCQHYSKCFNSPLRQAFDKYALYNNLNLNCPNNDFVKCNIDIETNIVNDVDIDCFNCSINKNCTN